MFSRNILTLVVLSCFATRLVTSAPSQQIHERDVEEIAGFVEGDMILKDGIRHKNGLIDEEYRWAGGVVVYELDPTFSAFDLTRIWAGLAELSNTTCITYRPRQLSDADWVFIQNGANGTGCYSSVGRVGGRQILNLEPRCVDRHGTIIHEMLHAIGFYHEQSRPDRDDYVTVVWDKIEEGLEHNFRKYTEEEVTTYGAPYDYGSVLHYGPLGFSIDGSPTLIPVIPGVEIGQRLYISQLDAGKVRLMYNCSASE